MEECIPGIETEKLKQAARYLLDPIYGAKRTERFIGWIARSEKPRLQKEARCMDIVFKLFQLSAVTGRKFLELCEKQRDTVLTPKIYVQTKTRRDKAAVYVKELRRRRRLAVETEEFRRGECMSPKEAKAFADEKQRLWDIRRQKYIDERAPGTNSRKASMEFTEMLVKEIEDKWAQAKAQGPIKRSTPSKSKLDALANRFGHQ